MGRASISRYSGTLGWLYQPEPTRPKKSQRDETFLRLKTHGAEASITWGYHVAARIASWRAVKNEHNQEWQLTATAAQVDPFCLRQTQPTLLFTAGPAAPSWPVLEVGVQGNTIRARLGPVEF